MSGWRELLGCFFARREELYGINRRNVELVYANNARADYPMADDKALCKDILTTHGVPVPETIALCEGLFAIKGALDAVADRGDFVIKPANSSQGNGILVIGKRAKENHWMASGNRLMSRVALHRHLANIVYGAFSSDLGDRAIIEERVDFHPELNAISGGGGSDIRVLTLDRIPFLSMLRVPTKQSLGRANLHQGAIGVAIDLDSGKTTRARIAGKSVDTHPDSGVSLIGIQIPDWPSILETSRAAAAAMPLGYLGVDILVDAHRGPLVVEVNARPGLEIQNVSGFGIGRALNERIDHAL